MTLKKTMKELEKNALQHRGTDLGGLLQWAHLHIGNLTSALADTEAELQGALARMRPMEAELEHLCRLAGDMRSRILDALPINPYATCAHDTSSYVNLMAAKGIKPYAKTPSKPRVVTT